MAAGPERRGDGERRQHVGGVEMAEHDAVANIGPRRLARQVHIEPFGGRETLLGRSDDQRTVEQRYEADGQRRRPLRFRRCLARVPVVDVHEALHPRSLALVTRPRAISAMRRLSFIAVLRRSA